MNTKTIAHTTGPWTLILGQRGEAFVEALEGDVLVAECVDNGEANARLIAESPNLLHELWNAANSLDAAAETFDQLEQPATANLMRYRATQAREAIAKAEGR